MFEFIINTSTADLLSGRIHHTIAMQSMQSIADLDRRLTLRMPF